MTLPAQSFGDSDWCIETRGFDVADLDKCSGRFMIGNGAVGVRGTLEEFSKDERVACTLAGLYDQLPGCWREPVNAPNGFFLRAWANGQLLSPLALAPREHRQQVDLRAAVHRRETSFMLADGAKVRMEASRFLSAARVLLGVAWHQFTSDREVQLVIETGIDGDVWDINGPHLEAFSGELLPDEILRFTARTQEKHQPVVVTAALAGDFARAQTAAETRATPRGIFRRVTLAAKAGETYTFEKFLGIAWGHDAANGATNVARDARTAGRATLRAEHAAEWVRRWAQSDVEIGGDEAAQRALRHSIYQLLLATPAHSDRMSIPARGLSGQVYKGGVFWDTEMFMLPFFDHTQPAMARSLLRYRYHTLDGARRKAAELGWRGSFYAWESQDSGDDACTLFNVTDVFTGRPMRTYFKDKQVHISADVAFATWRHFHLTGDASFLLEGGAEVILECARFFLSHACFNADRQRYEIRDVVGPDEYHERVDNNAFTSAMAHATAGIALELLAWLDAQQPAFAQALLTRLGYAQDAARLVDLHERLFVPAPDPVSGVIEQFSGYYKLEDTTLAAVKSRVLKANEYWGGGNGVAVPTQILKQADTVLLMHLFSERYPAAIRQANWEFYEPRTEHGSSLSACMYALVAASVGKVEWAYRYFLKTATIDLTGESKQYIGPLYIGGTHPAANGGAWMAAVLGFGGLVCDAAGPKLTPRMPAAWQRLAFRFVWRGNWFSVRIEPDLIEVQADEANPREVPVEIAGERRQCAPGQTVSSVRAEAVAHA